MAEILHVKNFAGISDVSLELNSRLTIVIGPQASGKSVIAKLSYFFKRLLSRDLFKDVSGKDKSEIDKSLSKCFNMYFPKNDLGSDMYVITYSNNDIKIEVLRLSPDGDAVVVVPTFFYDSIILYYRTLSALISEEGNKRGVDGKAGDIRLMLEQIKKGYLKRISNKIFVKDQYFVVAERSFFNLLQRNMFRFFSSRVNFSIDKLMLDYWTLTELASSSYNEVSDKIDRRYVKLIDTIILSILKGHYVRHENKEFIKYDDGRLVSLNNSSSGQKALLPLIAILRVFGLLDYSEGAGLTLFIEEPESHIFPESQKLLVNLIALICNMHDEIQFVITTHSPYILSSINNLIQASNTITEDSDKKVKVNNIIPEDFWMKFKDVSAYSLSNGEITSIIDSDLNLISPTALDCVSNDISNEFNEIISL